MTVCNVTFFDQRGCGRSTPRGALHANTSAHLVADTEKLRRHLGIGQWLVFGGSWGAGLALAYAAAHRPDCLGLVLRGTFLGRDSDIDWFFQGAKQLLPNAWHMFSAAAPVSAHGDLLGWLTEGIQADDEALALARCLAWDAWESSVSQRQPARPRTNPLSPNEASALLHKYRVQSHYLQNACFWQEVPVLSQAHKLVNLPTAILHGRLDWVCRPEAAWAVHQSLPGSRLQWLESCGHSPFEPDMTKALLHAVAHFAQHENFSDWTLPDTTGAAP